MRVFHHKLPGFNLVKRYSHISVIITFLPFFLFLETPILFSQSFDSVTPLVPFTVSKNSAEATQSKVWQYAGKWWAVFPTSDGTYVWKLNGTTWANVLKIASSSVTKADCKAVDDICHVFLFRDYDHPSLLVSLQYDPIAQNYVLWPERPSPTEIALDEGVETASIDIDGAGRMWLASDGVSDIRARWSDPPYSNWSEPVIIASGVTDDDIGAVISLPLKGQISVFWSNQNTKRFGFKVHDDRAHPREWSQDEIPASQSALDIKLGMADDHIDLAFASDGSLYAACKTGYDTNGYPKIILLKRQPNGTWDNAYEVSDIGTKPVLVINQSLHKIKVIFLSESGGGLLYKESPLEDISFGPSFTLTSGTLENPTSAKDNYNEEVVMLATDIVTGKITGVICKESPNAIPAAPRLLSPSNGASHVPVSASLRWEYAKNSTGFRVQLSSSPDFSSLLLDKTNMSTSYVAVEGLTAEVQYFWRVQAANAIGTSGWSETWKFTARLTPGDLDENSVGVFPNPVTNSLFVNLPPGTDYSISIGDCQGRILYRAYTSTNQLTVPIDNLGLETGLYVLSVQSKHFTTARKFFKK